MGRPFRGRRALLRVSVVRDFFQRVNGTQDLRNFKAIVTLDLDYRYDLKLDVIENQIGQEEILWFAAKSGPKCGDSVVTSIHKYGRGHGGEDG